MRSLLASFARATIGFGSSVAVALSVVASRLEPGSSPGTGELRTTVPALALRLLAWAPSLLGLALLGFAIGLVPAVLLRAPVPWPFASGAAAGLFWIALALAGVPYSLGLTTPAGIFIVSVFLAVFVSAASIGRALTRGSIGGALAPGAPMEAAPQPSDRNGLRPDGGPATTRS